MLLGEEHERPYERPQLSKDHLQGRSEREKIFVHPSGWYAEHDVELQLGTRIARVDAGAHELTAANGRPMRYDKLLLCSGSSPRQLPVTGADLDGVLYLRTVGTPSGSWRRCPRYRGSR